MREHAHAMIDLRRGEHQPRRLRTNNVSKALRARLFAKRPEALEAEHVVAIGADMPFVLILRFALAAGGAEVTGVTAEAVTFASGHEKPPYGDCRGRA
jgi:hypothetical protein